MQHLPSLETENRKETIIVVWLFGMGIYRNLIRKADFVFLLCVLLLHVAATFIFLPPWEVFREKPLYYVDHPVHTHRIHVYRQAFYESGLPWGYDPQVSAGYVLDPHAGIGAIPQQLLGIILPFLSPGAVERFFLFFVILVSPLWVILSCRRLKLSVEDQAWILVVLLTIIWLRSSVGDYFRWGLVSFFGASYFSLYVFTLFFCFIQKPSIKGYFGFCVAASILFLLHVLGPVPIILPLMFFTLTADNLKWSWRCALMAVPICVLLVNAFWVVPFYLSSGAGWPLRPPIQGMNGVVHLNVTSLSQLRYIFEPTWLFLRFCALSVAFYGVILLRKVAGNKVASSLVLAILFCFMLRYVGSFFPILKRMQPVRFIVPGYVFLIIPMGLAMSNIIRKIKLPTGASAAMMALIIAVWAGFQGEFKALPLPPSPDPLVNFISKATKSADRLLIQSKDGYQIGDYEAIVLPLVLNREVIGCTFPVRRDPAQFLSDFLWGKELSAWSPHELFESIERWDVSWAFTRTEDARKLFEKTFGMSGREVGPYRAFKLPVTPTRYLIGKGKVQTNINRLELTEVEPENGMVVLQYRYHPAWKTNSGVSVQQYTIPEDIAGFIALKDPPESIVLYFDSKLFLNAPWRKNK